MRGSSGTFLGVPYNWQRPTIDRFRRAFWNPSDRRLFVPKVFGWGWDLNFYELLRRLRRFPGRGSR